MNVKENTRFRGSQFSFSKKVGTQFKKCIIECNDLKICKFLNHMVRKIKLESNIRQEWDKIPLKTAELVPSVPKSFLIKEEETLHSGKHQTGTTFEVVFLP